RRDRQSAPTKKPRFAPSEPRPYSSRVRKLRIEIPGVGGLLGMEGGEIRRLAFRAGCVFGPGVEIVRSRIFDALLDVAAPVLRGVALHFRPGIERRVVGREDVAARPRVDRGPALVAPV